MSALIFILCSFFIFLLMVAGALFWYFKSVNFNHEDLCEKGFGAFQKQDYEKAKEMFLLSLADKPDFRDARYNLALTFVAMKDYDNARKCFEEILRLDPEDFDARYNLGLLFFRTGDYVNARKCFEVILETNPRDLDTLFNLGLTCQMQKSYEEAEEFYLKVLQSNEKDADCYYNLGIISFEQKNYEKALELFEKAIELAFDRPEIMFAALRCKDEMCNYETEEEGHEILNSYIRLSKYSDLPLEFDIFWANAYAKIGKMEKAFEIANRALVSSPNDAMVYRLLGLIKLLQDELEEAKKLLLKAIDLDIYHADGYNILSYVFLQQGNQLEYITYKTKYKEIIAENTVNAG